MADYSSYLEYLKHIEDATEKSFQDKIKAADENAKAKIKRITDDFQQQIAEKESYIKSLQSQIEEALISIGSSKDSDLKTEIITVLNNANEDKVKMKSDLQSKMDKEISEKVELLARFSNLENELKRQREDHQKEIFDKTKEILDNNNVIARLKNEIDRLNKMIIRNQPIGFYCRYDAQNPMCRRRKLS